MVDLARLVDNDDYEDDVAQFDGYDLTSLFASIEMSQIMSNEQNECAWFTAILIESFVVMPNDLLVDSTVNRVEPVEC